MVMQYSIADTSKQPTLCNDVQGADGGWSPQQQTARMLALCEAQMEAAAQDSDVAVDLLVSICTDMMATINELCSKVKDCNDPLAQQHLFEEMNTRCSGLQRDVAAAIVSFQFYDRLSQRMGHVRYSLSTLALFICDRTSSQRPENWDKLLTTLGRLYRTVEERAIFDNVAGSLSLTVGPDTAPPLAKEMAEAGSVELF